VDIMVSHPRYGWNVRKGVATGSKDVDIILVSKEETTPPVVFRPGDRAPDLEVAQWLNGEGPESLKALRGKVVVLQFATAYNPAVEAQNEVLKALHVKYASQGLVILAIYDASLSPQDTAAYVRAQGLPYPIGLVQGSRRLGWDRPAFKNYGVRSVPSLFVIGPQGRFRWVNPPLDELERRLRSLLEELGRAGEPARRASRLRRRARSLPAGLALHQSTP
jgi:peroxiredoxin